MHTLPGNGAAERVDASRRALRTIAAFEALKGGLAVGAGLGLLGLLHRDIHPLATSLIGHIGLDPGAHYPALFLHDVDLLRDVNLRTLLAALTAYAVIRCAEAWGLWAGRPWGAWLGALSGALYVPFELRHFWHRPTWLAAAVIGVNVLVVAFLARQLWNQQRVDAC
jgi:uncharacterized membrane protein (DUF2068 family)